MQINITKIIHKTKVLKNPLCGVSQLYQQSYNWSQPVLLKLGGTNTPHVVIGCLHTWIDAFCILKCKLNFGLITKVTHFKRKKYLAHILPKCFSVKYPVLPKHLTQLELETSNECQCKQNRSNLWNVSLHVG